MNDIESELNFMTCKLCVKHKKVNVMTGNECRNWKANTLKRHAHSADHKQSVVARGYDLVLVSFECV